MKAKTKIILSLLTFAGYWLGMSIYKFFYSPLAGVATAQTVKEGLVEYTWAKYLREGGMERLALLTLFLVLVSLWFFVPYRTDKTDTN